MKKAFYLNSIIYFSVVVLYLYQPIYGAMSQLGLGLFQLVIAALLHNEIKQDKSISYKYLRIYWCSILIWLILYVINSISVITKNYELLLFIIPMIIGFYFVLVTYLALKKHSTVNS